MARIYNIESVRGDTLPFNLTFTDNAGDPVNITGYTVWLTVKTNRDDIDADAIVQKTVTSHDDPTGGITSILVEPADTDDLLGNYFYDVQVQDADGNVTTYLIGNWKFTKDITRTTV